MVEKQENSLLYYPIREDAARRAKEMNSFSDYKEGSATAEYRRCVDQAVEIAKQQKEKVDSIYHGKIDALAERMHLSTEDTDLARLIALLHDIGRFEQLKRYDSFEPGTMDHAAYGVKVLFDEGMIRRFLPDDKWDSIIYTAIAHHSDYELPEISDSQTLLHAKLIRDEDKLDNCRVKLVDSTSTFINVSEEELGTQNITQKVYETVFKNKCILSADRVTQMDYWVSYIVYFFDINFKESFDIIAENDYLNRIIDRIPYSNPVTKEQMENIRVYMQNFINSHTNGQSF